MVSIHNEKIQAFQKIIQNDRLGHAYLFFGDEGVGKETVARALAHFLEGGSFEVEEMPLIDAQVFCAGEKGSIGIDVVRSIRTFLWSTPLVSSRRTAIIEGAHALTLEAQSALLKIVEEPPAHGLLVFVTHEPSVLLAPILSRLSKVYFPRFSVCELQSLLVKEHAVPEKKAEMIAKIAFGRIGRALRFLEGTPVLENDIKEQIREDIVRLWNKDKFSYARVLSLLLDREMYIARFTLNPNLQKKAIDYIKTTLPIE